MAKQASFNRREIMFLGGFLAVGSGVSFMLNATRPLGDTLPDTPVLRAAYAESAPIGGNPDGNLTVLVFTDFNCGACRLAHPALAEAVEKDGQIRLHYLDWPILSPQSKEAAFVAQAANEQGLYEKLHAKMMFGPQATHQTAMEALEAVGGNIALAKTHLVERASAYEGRLSRYAIHAFGLGLGGTPGHIAGQKRLRGAFTRKEFQRAFQQARA